MKTVNEKMKTTIASLSMILMMGSACSLRERTEVHNVSVQLPAEWANASTMSIFQNSGANYYSTPTSLASFQCYGLNVTGPGIQSDPRMGCTDPNSQMGQLAGFVPITKGSIEMNVLAGAQRKVELIGIQSTIGCPILSELLASGGTEALHALGDPYILGSTTTDIFDDTAVTIFASFDSTRQAFEGCGDHNNGSMSNELRLQVVNNSPAIQSQNCSPFGVYATGVGPFPAIKPEILAQPMSGTATIYDDSYCTHPVSSYYSFSGTSNFLNFWVKTSSSANGGFSAKVDTTATGWTTPTVIYSIVTDRLMSNSSGNTNINTCYPISVTNVVDAAASVGGTIGVIDLEVHNNNPGASTPSQMQVYTSSTSCGAGSGALTATSNSGGSTYYTLPSVSANSSTFYVKNTAGEAVSIGMTKPALGAEPVQVSVAFIPFTLSTISYLSLQGPSNVQFTFSLPFQGNTQAAVDAIKFGSYDCGTVTKTTGTATCTTPVMPTGSYPITIISGGQSYPLVGQYLSIGVQPFLNNPSMPFNNCTATACTYVSASNYTFQQNSAQSLTLNSGGMAITNCGVSPALPAGMYLGADCLLSGTPTTVTSATTYTFFADVIGTHYSTLNVGVTISVAAP